MKNSNLKNQKSIVENSGKNKKPEKEEFSYSIYNKNNFKKFCELKENKTAKLILQKDLPSEFDAELCEFLNLFRRKTIDEKSEWEFYIDYENNEIIHCLHGKSTKVKDWIHSGLMKNKKILSIHNHIKGTYSAPSCENFEILNHEFEDYEIICAEKEYWVLEAKGKFDDNWICDVKKEIYKIFKKCDSLDGFPDEKVQLSKNELYKTELEILINNLKSNISLRQKEYG